MKNYPSRGVARCSQYNVDADASNVNLPQTQLIQDTIGLGNAERVRQAGNLRKIKFTANNFDVLLWMKIVIWREDGSGTFTRIATSENILTDAVEGALNEHTFTTQMPVEYGDYIGFQAETTDTTTHVLRADTGLGVNYEFTRFDSGVAGDTLVDWDAQTRFSGLANPLSVYVDAPVYVPVGDSIPAGHRSNDTFLEAAGDVAPETTYPYKVAELLGWTHQNMSIGGQTTSEIEARFDADVISLLPSWVSVGTGLNDIDQLETLATYQTAVKSIVSKCADANINLLFQCMLPWNAGTDDQMRERDSWTAWLKSYVKDMPNVHTVDAEYYMGVNRAGGTPGNLWDQNLYADGDNAHWTPNGYTILANVMKWGFEAMDGVVLTQKRKSEEIIYFEDFKNASSVQENNGIVKNVNFEFPTVENGLQINDPYIQGVYINDLIGKLAGVKTGSITVKSKLNKVVGTAQMSPAFTISNNANAVLSEFWVFYDMRAGNNYLLIGFYVDGVAKWFIETAVDSALAWVGEEITITVVQDGTSPVVYVNDVAVSQSFSSSGDKTVWFEDIINADDPADSVSVGMLRRNGTDSFVFDGNVYEVEITESILNVSEIEDKTSEDTFTEIAEDKFMLNLPLKTYFNDGINDVTENIGKISGNAIIAGGKQLRTPHGIVLDGSNDYLKVIDSVENNYNFDGSEDFSIVIMFDSEFTNDTLITRRDTKGWLLYLDADQLNFFLDFDTSYSGLKGTKVINDGAIHHAICTFRASDKTRRIFIDGELDATGAAISKDFSEAGLDLYVGINQALSADFNGEIMRPRIADFEITPTQARELYKRDLNNLNQR